MVMGFDSCCTMFGLRVQQKKNLTQAESANASTTQPSTRLSPAQMEAKLKLSRMSSAISEKLKEGKSLAGRNTP